MHEVLKGERLGILWLEGADKYLWNCAFRRRKNTTEIIPYAAIE
jgi:hypothetical protein